jgi:hypothetical protein
MVPKCAVALMFLLGVVREGLTRASVCPSACSCSDADKGGPSCANTLRVATFIRGNVFSQPEIPTFDNQKAREPLLNRLAAAEEDKEDVARDHPAQEALRSRGLAWCPGSLPDERSELNLGHRARPWHPPRAGWAPDS